MEPRWPVIKAVVGGALTIAVCFVLLRIAQSIWTESNEQIVAFLATMKNIGPHTTIEEKMWGLASFGLVIICVLAVVRILARSR